MGLFRPSRTPSPDVLYAFAQLNGLVAAEPTGVDDYLPRSCQVVDAHQLHGKWNSRRHSYWAFAGTLPGGTSGGIAHVHISGQDEDHDYIDIVRSRSPQQALLSTLEIQGRLGGELGAYGGHRTADVPFRIGDSRKVEVPGVGRHRVRVTRAADDAAISSVFGSGFGNWLATANPAFTFELFDGWVSVFRIGPVDDPDEAVYPALCDATARFVAACQGLPTST